MYDTKICDKAGKLRCMLIKIACPYAGCEFSYNNKTKWDRILECFHTSNNMTIIMIYIQLKGFADTFSNV